MGSKAMVVEYVVSIDLGWVMRILEQQEVDGEFTRSYDPRVRDLCDSLSPNYTAHETEYPPTMIQIAHEGAQRARLLNFTLARKSGRPVRVLDVGSGDGKVERELFRIAGVKTVAIDVSKGMLKEARKSVPEALYAQASAGQMPFRSEEFDLGFLSFGICSFAEGAIAEAARVIKPGAYALLSAYNAHAFNLLIPTRNGRHRTAAAIDRERGTMTVNGQSFSCRTFTPGEFRNEINKAGFKVIELYSSLGLASVLGHSTLVRVMRESGAIPPITDPLTQYSQACEADEAIAASAGVGMYLVSISQRRRPSRAQSSAINCHPQNGPTVTLRRVT